MTNGDKKRAILLSVCGPVTYGLIRSLVQPQKPTEFSYTQLVEKVKKHYNPRPSAIVQRNSLKRQPGETVAHYVAELRKLTEYCEFGDTLDDMLRDKLVWGIEDARTQERLLAEDKLTFKKPRASPRGSSSGFQTYPSRRGSQGTRVRTSPQQPIARTKDHKRYIQTPITMLPMWRSTLGCPMSLQSRKM